ncbi:HEPN domain-containing protein [Pyrofollis japonicus]|uniref:HEPN domain-containing protein n=1 Tax=Pyrofollis japonicus TaxID=3060460 RepID=UPI00295BC293|nr:HEPN domain-containing protein [Pyrofollis japonicus]BEP16922.1 HEPN domain-containing protein [Pyrofollis japonicus]
MRIRRESYLWLQAAREDIEDAELMLEEGRWFRVAFFAQQAVEKALKALYPIVALSEPPRTHSVTELYRGLVRAGFRLPRELEDKLYIFNKYYTVTRYPDAANGLPSESVDKEEAERALALAKRILGFIEEFIRKAEGQAAGGGSEGSQEAD